MTASHGRAGRRGRRRLATALATSGLFLALSAARPTRADLMHQGAGATAAAGSSTASPSTATTPGGPAWDFSPDFERALQTFLQGWQDKMMGTSQAMAPTPGAAAGPSVENWHQATSSTCTPPPPCSCQTSSTGTLPAGSGSPSAPLPSSSGLAGASATPAPEPSTIVSAVALIGALAWRRRAARPRA